MTSEARDYAAIAAAWEVDVLAGRFPAGKLFRAAVERQRRDVASPPAGFRFEARRAARACALIESLPHAEGPKRGEPFVMEGWQVWSMRVLFGWWNPTTRAPRFTRATLFMPKGNGKTPLAAAIALAVLMPDKTGGKVFSAATTREQARLSFDTGREMLRLAPALRDAARLAVGEHAIKGRGDNREFRPLSAEADSLEGKIPLCVIIDEIHAHPDRTVYDNLRTACAKRADSRLVVISTAGFDQSPQAIGWQLYQDACAILRGEVDAPEHFALVIEADRELDPWDPVTWRQANPNLDVSVSSVGLASEAAEAKRQPSAQASFFTKHLGWWVQTANAWMDLSKWDECADPSITLADFEGRTNFLGIDFAPRRDMTGRVLLGVTVGADGQRHYLAKAHGYLPEESDTVRDTPAVRDWVAAGQMTLHPGSTMSLARLRSDIEADIAALPGLEPCADPYGALSLIQDLAAAGIVVTEIPQTWRFLSGAMKELEAAIYSGRFKHDGSLPLRWCMGNVVADLDRNGNMTPDRESDAKKIDLAAALFDAMARAIVVQLGAPDAGVGLRFISLDDEEEDSQWVS